MDEVFDFDTQLQTGDKGESDFQKYYKSLSPKKVSDRRFDFVLDGGKTVELKTDTYDMDKTPNFFMELFGNIADEKIGGPWRAMQDSVDFFVYYFPKNKAFFWFEPSKLCKVLDQLVAQGQLTPKDIRNKTWCGRGYAVPRKALLSVQIRQDSFFVG